MRPRIAAALLALALVPLAAGAPAEPPRRASDAIVDPWRAVHSDRSRARRASVSSWSGAEIIDPWSSAPSARATHWRSVPFGELLDPWAGEAPAPRASGSGRGARAGFAAIETGTEVPRGFETKRARASGAE